MAPLVLLAPRESKAIQALLASKELRVRKAREVLLVLLALLAPLVLRACKVRKVNAVPRVLLVLLVLLAPKAPRAIVAITLPLQDREIAQMNCPLSQRRIWATHTSSARLNPVKSMLAFS